MKTFAKIAPILILSLLSSPLLLLQSCGDTAPFGSTITLVATSSAAVDPLNTFKSQSFRVSASDSSGNPMNGIAVQISGGKAGINYGFNAQPTPGVTSFTITTGNSGYNNFTLVGPVSIPRQLFAPTNLTTSASTLAGSLLAGNYCYQITAIDGTGQTTPSAESCATLSVVAPATGQVTLQWPAVTGATGYNIYGNTNTGVGKTLMRTGVITLTYTDDGVTDTPDGVTSPPTTNSTATTLLSNNFLDTLTGISGPVISTLPIVW